MEIPNYLNVCYERKENLWMTSMILPKQLEGYNSYQLRSKDGRCWAFGGNRVGDGGKEWCRDLDKLSFRCELDIPVVVLSTQLKIQI